MARNPHKNPNPQGKGLVPVLSDWQATRVATVRAKSPVELLLDWFVSTLVLSAEFRFRPVVGQQYYLYRCPEKWSLSLVAPQEWRERAPGYCLGECALRPDMTWDFAAREEGLAEPEVKAALAAVLEDFTQSLASEADVATLLPGYQRQLPYYQRMLATGLGASLRRSASLTRVLDAPAADLLAVASETLPRRLDGTAWPGGPSG